MTRIALGRRAFLGGLGASALGLALAGCGGSGSGGAYQQPAGKVPAQYSKRQRVVAWHRWSSANGKAIATLADRFNASQDDVYLDLQPQTGSYDNLSAKVATALQAKQTPDLVSFSEVTWHQFFLNQALEPLDGYFGSDFDRSTLNQKLLSHGELSGKLWWMPIAESTPIMYYNKEIVKQAGLPDRTPKTWSEMRSFGPNLKGLKFNGSSPKLIVYVASDGDWPFQGVLWNFGGGISQGLDVIIDNDASVDAWEYQRAICNDDHMAYMATSPETDFENGLATYYEGSSGSMTSIFQSAKFEVGTGFVPAEKSREVPTGGGGFSIMAKASSDSKKGAFKFLQFLCEPEQAAFWSASSGYLPLIDSAQKTQTMKTAASKYPGLLTLFDQLPYSRKEDDVALFVPNASTTIYTGLQKVWSQNSPAKSTASEVASELSRSAQSIQAQYKKLVS